MDIERAHIDHSIRKFSKLMRQEDMFPTVTIKWKQQRKDSMLPKDEATLWEQSTDGTIFSGVSFAASPHTNSTLRVVDVIKFSDNALTELPQETKALPAHCVVWWGEEEGSHSIPMNRIALLEPNTRRELVNAIAEQTEQTVFMFEKLIPSTPHELGGSKRARIYGLWGHATAEERTTYGLGRGSQSHPEGHLHVVHFSRPTTELKQLSNDELLKQLGSWDTVIHEKFESEIVEWLHRLVADYDPALVVSVHADQEHGRRSDNSRIVFFEGYKIQFLNERVSLGTALDIIASIAQQYDAFYETARNSYEAYHLSAFSDERAEVKQQLVSDLTNRFGQDSSQSIVDFITSIPPTRGQYDRWHSIIHERAEQEATNDKKIQLESLAAKYKHKADVMERQLNRIQDSREEYIAQFQSHYGITHMEASLLLTLSEDRLKPADAAGQFIFPVRSSGSFLISNYVQTSHGIEVLSLSVSTRLATNKGVVEDLAGTALRRSEAR